MGLAEDLAKATQSVSKEWKKAKQKADKEDRVSSRSLSRMRYYAPARTTVREVAFEVMEEAYNKASANGKYYANARQIMYAARPAILERADTKELSDVYFTQTLLKDYLEAYDPDWKVVWDARGNLIEPYNHYKIPLGGIGVNKYQSEWTTGFTFAMPKLNTGGIGMTGPKNHYSNALFIEKEGFSEILTDAGIMEQYDMALLSTKGIPNDASCNLIGALVAQGVRVFVLHDFDLAGFKIVKTLRQGTRLTTGSEVVDIGLRLADIDGLQDEDTVYKQAKNPSGYLRKCGVTEAEVNKLVAGRGYSGWHGRRVEINAMTSDQLINWLKGKLEEHKVEKVVPDIETLNEAYQSARRVCRIERKIQEVIDEEDAGEDEAAELPEDLRAEVLEKMKNGSRKKSWDTIIWSMAEESVEGE